MEVLDSGESKTHTLISKLTSPWLYPSMYVKANDERVVVKPTAFKLDDGSYAFFTSLDHTELRPPMPDERLYVLEVNFQELGDIRELRGIAHNSYEIHEVVQADTRPEELPLTEIIVVSPLLNAVLEGAHHG